MRELQFIEAGRIEWREVPEPRLDSASAALVRPLAVGTCDLDAPIARGKIPLPGPFALGHEFVGEIVAVGEHVTGVTIGTRVSVPFQISCGTCPSCRRGSTGRCTGVDQGACYGLGPLGGTTNWGGAMADLVRVPYADAMCIPIPIDADPAALAGLSDNLPDGWRTVAPYLDRENADRRVLVLGRGSVGLYATAVARAMKAAVTYVDRDQRNCEIAERLGAIVLQEPLRDRYESHPIVASTSSTVDGLRAAVASTSPDGVCTDTGILFGDVALPMLTMYTKGISLVTGRINARASMPAALELVASGALDLNPMITATASWTDAPQAWADHHGRLILTR